MRITYDKLADAMSIRFNNKPSDGVVRVNEFVNVRMATDDTIVGIELLQVSQYADNLDAIAEQYDIEKVLAAERAARHAE